MKKTEASRLYLAGFLLLFAGMTILFLGSAAGPSSTSFGGVVFIGPFPIAFGAGPGAGTLILIGVVISVAMVLIFFLSFFLSRRANRQGDQGFDVSQRECRGAKVSNA